MVKRSKLFREISALPLLVFSSKYFPFPFILSDVEVNPEYNISQNSGCILFEASCIHTQLATFSILTLPNSLKYYNIIYHEILQYLFCSNLMSVDMFLTFNYICIPESFNTNISYQLFQYTIIFVNSHSQNTISKGNFVLKNHFYTFVFKITGILK